MLSKKKIFSFVVALQVLLLCMVLLTSCSNEIYYSTPEGSLKRLFVQEKMGLVLTQAFSWDSGGLGLLEFSEDGSVMRITGTSNWMNYIGFDRANSNYYLDFSDVTYIAFDIKGTIALDCAKVFVNTAYGSISANAYLDTWAVNPSSYGEDSICHIEIDISNYDQMLKETVIRPWVMVANNDQIDGSKSYAPGQWVEVSNIDYLDANRNHVDIGYAPIVGAGSFSSAFKNLKIQYVEPQPWNDTVTMEVRDTGIKIFINEYGYNPSWFGGQFLAAGGYADFTNVSSMSIDVRGNVKPDELKLGYGVLGGNRTYTLNELDPTKSYDEENWATYRINIDNITEIQRTYFTSLLVFGNATYPGPNKWFELNNITYYDRNGNALNIYYSDNEEPNGTWNDLFPGVDPEATNLDFQVWNDWSGNCSLYLTEEGLKIVPTGEWAGGAIVNHEANLGETCYKHYDFSNIDLITYKVKGTMDPDYFSFYLLSEDSTGVEVHTPSGTLYANGVTSITENVWTNVEVNVPSNITDVINPLTFVTSNKGSNDKSGWAGRYIIIRDVEFWHVNADGSRTKVLLNFL